MSEEQLKAFLEKVKADSSLQEKLKSAKSPEDVVGIAKEHGHEFGEEHIEAGQAHLDSLTDEMSDAELEAAAGGGFSMVNKQKGKKNVFYFWKTLK